MELKYNEEIKDDVFNMIGNESKRNPILKSCIARVIHENDYYMSEDAPIERDCYYIAIGAYVAEINNVDDMDDKVLKEIKRSINTIELGKYNDELTDEDKKYISEDIKTIKESNLF